MLDTANDTTSTSGTGSIKTPTTSTNIHNEQSCLIMCIHTINATMPSDAHTDCLITNDHWVNSIHESTSTMVISISTQVTTHHNKRAKRVVKYRLEERTLFKTNLPV